MDSEDFKVNTDIVPVSDPNIFAESQRYAQIQTLAARAAANPDLYNRLAVEKRILKQIKLPDINEVLPDPQDVKEMNPALENVAMTLGKPVGAFPMQDHIAHIITHLDYFKDPMYGSNPIMIISDNSMYGTIGMHSYVRYPDRKFMDAMRLTNPDFAAWGRAFGCVGITIETEAEVPSKIAEAFAVRTKPVVVHCKTSAIQMSAWRRFGGERME